MVSLATGYTGLTPSPAYVYVHLSLMPRLTLSTVSADVHLEIIRHYLEIYRKASSKDAALLRDISLVCRSLNDACGTIIFHKYYIDLRQAELSVETDGTAVKHCYAEAISQRLYHLERKAPFVRKLRIIVRNDSAEILPSLCATVQKLRGLISVHLISSSSDSTLLDIDLWNRLVDVRPATLSLKGRFHPHDGLALPPIGDLTSLKISVYQTQSRTIVNALSPRHIYLHCDRDCKPLPYKPVDCNLRHVSIEIDALSCKVEDPFLDFSGVSQAYISVKVTFYVPTPLIEPLAWQITREKLQRMFAEDLSGFDVRHYEERVYISRSPEEGWEPVYQDHVRRGSLVARHIGNS